MENEREKSVEQIKHRFHEHLLVFVEQQSNEGEKAYCSGCMELVSGPCFSCVECKYHLHKKCAEAPYAIYNHPLHCQHSRLFLHERPSSSDKVYGCAFCKEKRNMFFYECLFCYFSLDIKCADLSSSYKYNQESKHDIHYHPLAFIESPMDELKRLCCSYCHEPLVDPIYFCFDCPFILHKKCLDELPTKIKHPSHRKHPLFLECNNNDRFCKLCQKEHSGSLYCCSHCHFNIGIECARPRSVVEDKNHHQHPFTLVWRQDSFICDACSTEGNYISYICSTCSFTVHKKCTLLPRIVKITRHDHCMFHNYFLEEQELRRQDCNICFNEVKLERGSYSCLKPDCNYIVHVNCAIENDDLYYIVDQESQCEELNENLAKSKHSSINRVIEVNEDGEATKIEHFNHAHCIMLADKIKKDNDRNCAGCMLLISTPFYYCSECDFFLHKTCAELPRTKHHWFHRFVSTLKFKDFQECFLCNCVCSGLFYKSKSHGNNFNFCLRCAIVPDIIKCEGHEHFLFFDYKCTGQCNACGVGSSYGAFRCGKCTFALDFACLTLPHSVPHKFDEHLLNLTYHDENDDTEPHYCDSCEEERDPNHWYYSCPTCDTSAHPKCVLGEYPFVKNGITWPFLYRHDHNLLFFKKVDGYPKCSKCGKLCQDETFKCAESTCNYIIHCKCWWP